MRGWHLIPIGLVVLLLIALPVAALTETGVEEDVKTTLGIDIDHCEPPADLASPWDEEPALSAKRDEPRVAVIGGDAYLVGGTLEVVHSPGERLLLTPSDQLTRFDPRTGSYTELAPLPEALNHMGVVAYRGDVYALGGYGERVDAHTGKRFFRYDPATNRWTRLPDLPEPRAAMAAGVIGHELIVAGGARDRIPLATTYAYDFESGSWSRLPDMGSRREHVGHAVLDGRLYVLGGRAPESLAVDTAERYDPARRRWEALPRMPVPVGGVAAVAARGGVVAVGGGDDGRGTVSGAVQEFDPASDEWSLLSGLRIARHGHGVAFLGDRIWVFGGSDCAYYHGTDSVESLRLGAADGA
ncbi:MAG TPA: kelch repeat-containing protein [Solirubrobacterales bacterium]|nr:kelch repeat-containing protein [Solirubrobacterales bacterium]